jgi:predicted esterase
VSLWIMPAFVVVLTAACGGGSVAGVAETTSLGSGATDTGSSVGTADSSAATSSVGVTTDAPTDGSDDSSGGSPPANVPTDLPAVNGPCPAFEAGTVVFHPLDADEGQARLWVGDDPGGGPVVLYFHGTGMSPDDATWSIGEANIDAIVDQGGAVLAPQGHGRFAWWIAEGDTREDDLRLVDEMVACAIEQADIDPSRIHATGLSSGATLTSDMIHRRSNYLASAAPKSGGFDPYNPVPDNVAPERAMSALIFHGGPTDTWGDPPYEFYQAQAEALATIIDDEGGFAVVCDHGQGHVEPSWDADRVWAFFEAHPFDTSPSPWTAGLPAGFPDYCQIW